MTSHWSGMLSSKLVGRRDSNTLQLHSAVRSRLQGSSWYTRGPVHHQVSSWLSSSYPDGPKVQGSCCHERQLAIWFELRLKLRWISILSNSISSWPAWYYTLHQGIWEWAWYRRFLQGRHSRSISGCLPSSKLRLRGQVSSLWLCSPSCWPFRKPSSIRDRWGSRGCYHRGIPWVRLCLGQDPTWC